MRLAISGIRLEPGVQTDGELAVTFKSDDTIRQRFGITPIFGKMRKARLRRYGHVLEEEEV